MAEPYDISFVTVNGVRLRLAVSGDGPPLLFLFGSGAAGTIDNAKPFVEAQLVHAVLERGGSPWSVAAGTDPARELGLAMQLEARKGHDVVDRLGKITCPTMIGAGTYDGLAPADNAALMRASIPNSVLRVYDAGHFFYLGRKAFNDGLSFLTGLIPTPPPSQALTAEQIRQRFGGSCTT